MLRIYLSLAIVGSIFVATATDAEARRRGFRVPIIFSSGSSSPKIVKVRDWPNTSAFRRKDGRYVDLGWRHKRSGGEWVGYIGSRRRYVPLNEYQLKFLMRKAGMSTLPSPPARSSSSISSGWIWAVIGFIVFFGGWRFLKPIIFGATAVSRVAGRAYSKSQTGRGGDRSSAWDKADELITTAQMTRGTATADAAAGASSAGPKPRPRIGGAAKAARKPNVARPRAGMRSSPGFGRRG
ncbi:MAG: hypothetical protein AAFV26_08585 [Pseudomonadota bacterium]